MSVRPQRLARIDRATNPTTKPPGKTLNMAPDPWIVAIAGELNDGAGIEQLGDDPDDAGRLSDSPTAAASGSVS
jgi:hypothetical protein